VFVSDLAVAQADDEFAAIEDQSLFSLEQVRFYPKRNAQIAGQGLAILPDAEVIILAIEMNSPTARIRVDGN
jgi:hypothetical protein